MSEKGTNTNKVAVVHFIASNFVGGPEKQILTHLALLKKTDFLPYLISFNEKGGRDLKVQAELIGIKTFLLDSGTFQFAAVVFELKKILREIGADLICAHGFKAGFYSLVMKMIASIKFIAFSRGWTSENLKIYLYTLIDKFVIRFSNRIIAVSSSQRDRLVASGIDSDHIVVIENAVTISNDTRRCGERNGYLRTDLNINSDDVLLFSAGRLSPEKGHEFLLSAFDRVYEKHNNVHLVLAGSGPSAGQLEKQILNYRSRNNIHFLGFRNDIKKLYPQIDIFVLPSLSEGLPNVILEAMAYQLPIVSTNVGGVPEVITDKFDGLLVPSANPAALADAIVKLIEDPRYAKEIASNARQHVFERFDPENQTHKLRQLYLEVLGFGGS